MNRSRLEIFSQCSNLIYIRVSHAIVRVTGSGYETHYRQEVDWKYSASVQILYTLWSVMLLWDKKGL